MEDLDLLAKEFREKKLTFSAEEEKEFWKKTLPIYIFLLSNGFSEADAKSFLMAFLDEDHYLKIEIFRKNELGWHCLKFDGTTVINRNIRGWKDYTNNDPEVTSVISPWIDTNEVIKQIKEKFYVDKDYYPALFQKRRHEKYIRTQQEAKEKYKQETIQQGRKLLQALNLETYRNGENHLIEEDDDTLITKETKKTIIDIKSVAKELNKEDEATFIIQSLIHKYSSEVKRVQEAKKSPLSINPNYDVSVQSLFVEIYGYYLKLLEEKKTKDSDELKYKEIVHLDKSFNGEDVVKKTVTSLKNMAIYLGIYDVVNPKIVELEENIYNSNNSLASMSNLFNFYNLIKKQYDQAKQIEYDNKEFAELNATNETKQAGSK